MRRSILVATLVPCLAALAACTSSTPKSASSAPATTPSSSAAASASADNGGGSGDNEHLTSAQVVARYQAALAAIDAAHVKGTLIQGGQAATLDIQVNKDNTSEGSITTNATTIPFIGLSSSLGYIQYTAGLESAAKIDPASPVGKALLNKWASSNTTLGAAYNQAIAPMASWSSITQLTGPTTDTYAYQGTATVNGRQVVQYKDKSATAGVPDALVSFPVSGPMLPVQMSAGTSGGLSFVWNQPTKVTAPPAADLATTTQ